MNSDFSFDGTGCLGRTSSLLSKYACFTLQAIQKSISETIIENDEENFYAIMETINQSGEDLYMSKCEPESVHGYREADHWTNQPITSMRDETLVSLAILYKRHKLLNVLLSPIVSNNEITSSEADQLTNSKADSNCERNSTYGLGCLANVYNSTTCQSPVHVAAENKDSVSLKILLCYHENNTADVNAITQPSGQTALHIAVLNQDILSTKVLLGCKGINVDQRDNKGGCTPLYLAIRQAKSEQLVQLLLDDGGADCNIKCLNKNIKELIENNMPNIDLTGRVGNMKTNPLRIAKSIFSNSTTSNFNTMYDIFNLIEKVELTKEGEVNSVEIDFMSKLLSKFESSNDLRDAAKVVGGGLNLLQKITVGRCHKFIGLVLKRFSDMNVDEVTESVPYTPLQLAAKISHLPSLEQLYLRSAKFDVIGAKTSETILHILLKQNSSSYRASQRRHCHDCVEFVFSKVELFPQLSRIINIQDTLSGNTPIHLATQMWSKRHVAHLLKLGANVGIPNDNGDVPIQNIEPEIMKNFLNLCVQHQTSKSADNDEEDFEILDYHSKDYRLTFNFSFLAPPLSRHNPHMSDVSNSFVPLSMEESREDVKPGHQNLDYRTNLLPETKILWHMGNSRELRHLLKHPVISCFLFLKWIQIRRFYNRNIRFYSLFVYILTWFIFEQFGSRSLKNEQTKRITFFYKAFIPYACICSVYIVKDWISDCFEIYETLNETKSKASIKKFASAFGEDQRSPSKKALTKSITFVFISNWIDIVFVSLLIVVICTNTSFTLNCTLMSLIIALMIRELFQISISCVAYFKSVENWIELAISAILLFIITTTPKFLNEVETTQDISATSNSSINRILSAFALVLSWAGLITHSAKHPRLSKYNVYVTMFYQVLATFLSFLAWYVFFIVAFGLGFYILLHNENTNVSYPFFESPWTALVKTSTMFVGELEFADIPIDIGTRFAPLMYIFFLSFVFLIVVVLMNLLNGLAVNDTSVIQEEAEIFAHIARMEAIYYTESVMLGDPFNFLSKWSSCSLCQLLYRNKSIQQYLNKFTGSTGILLFYSVLPSNKKFTVFPNRAVNQWYRLVQDNSLSKDLVSEARLVAVENEKRGHSNMQEYAQDIQQRISKMERKLDVIIKTMFDTK